VARFFKLLIVTGCLLFAVAAFLYVIPSDKYILVPDRARPLAGQVFVQGERSDEDGGGIYYVAVEIEKASLLEKIFDGNVPWPLGREGSTLVPVSQIRAPGESDQEHRAQELRAMAESQKIGAAVALRELGYRVDVQSPGTVVAGVDPNGPSDRKLRAHDVIVSVDGELTPFLPDLRRAITKRKPGETVELKVRRGDQTRTVKVKTVADPKDKRRSLIGILTSCGLQTATKISLPVPVRIDLGRVGGPSAGLAFGLDVAEELGHDIDKGHRVAASGELCLDGSVVSVGGLKQKTIGARRAGVDVFLVPAGDNAEEARRYAGDMKVVPVNSFRQALRALATLPRERTKS
jgi:PDZ domain-containing protein